MLALCNFLSCEMAFSRKQRLGAALVDDSFRLMMRDGNWRTIAFHFMSLNMSCFEPMKKLGGNRALMGLM